MTKIPSKLKKWPKYPRNLKITKKPLKPKKLSKYPRNLKMTKILPDRIAKNWYISNSSIRIVQVQENGRDQESLLKRLRKFLEQEYGIQLMRSCLDNNKVVRGRCLLIDYNEVVHGRWSEVDDSIVHTMDGRTNVQHLGKSGMLERLINPWLSP